MEDTQYSHGKQKEKQNIKKVFNESKKNYFHFLYVFQEKLYKNKLFNDII